MNFSQLEHLEKKTNFILAQNSFFLLSLPVDKEIITNTYSLKNCRLEVEISKII